ncbi:MAG: M20/M25/M40 family metallo-hydrolase [Gemmatimonas sp.]
MPGRSPTFASFDARRAADQWVTRTVERTASASNALVARDAGTFALQQTLALIAAPTGEETVRAEHVAILFRQLGLETIRTDAVGSVIASLPVDGAREESDEAQPIVCMAHLDTVFPRNTELAIRHEGARTFCPGIGDNSRGLATMLSLAGALRSVGAQLTSPVQFVATVGEEGLGNLLGARSYFESRAHNGLVAPRAVLVLDGPGDSSIVHHALGSRRYRVTFRGAGGHSWADFGAPNAVHAASRAAAQLADLPRSIAGRVAITVSGIGGGESMNAIPSQAWFDLDVRASSNTLLMHVDRELRVIVRAAVAAETSALPQSSWARTTRPTRAFASEILLLGERPSGALSQEHELVQLALAATRYHGVDPVSAIASTDANVPLSQGIPAITIGGGGTGGDAHTIHEWYDNTNGSRGIVRAFSILAALATA